MDMQQQPIMNFNEAIKAIKRAILQSRYRAAKLANREMLSLYFGIGNLFPKTVGPTFGERVRLKIFRKDCNRNYPDLGDSHPQISRE